MRSLVASLADVVLADEGWLNTSLKSTETRDELSTTCNPK